MPNPHVCMYVWVLYVGQGSTIYNQCLHSSHGCLVQGFVKWQQTSKQGITEMIPHNKGVKEGNSYGKPYPVCLGICIRKILLVLKDDIERCNWKMPLKERCYWKIALEDVTGKRQWNIWHRKKLLEDVPRRWQWRMSLEEYIWKCHWRVSLENVTDWKMKLAGVGDNGRWPYICRCWYPA